VSEVVILPEMVEAGSQMLTECRERQLDDETTAVNVYLAMEGVLEIAILKAKGRIH
jgi:hypothetical protein